MLGWLASVVDLLPSFEVLAVLAVRSAAFAALGWLSAALLHRALPAARQAVWSAVIVGLLALPWVAAVVPAWKVLPIRASSAASASPLVLVPTLRPTSIDYEVRAGSHQRVLSQSLPAAPRWRDWGVVLWAAGAGWLTLALGLGLGRMRRVRLAGVAADDRLIGMARSLARDLGLRRPLDLRISSLVSSPATWGLWRPRIVLPPAALQWSDERCRLVLAHELAHVVRGDWAWRLLASVGCALYWFNPLIWIAARRLRFEQELACDLAVLEGGARPSRYAHHLLAIARVAARGRNLPLAALDMARRSQMEGRLMSILTERPRRTVGRALLLPALSLVLALPVLAAIEPQPAPVPAADPTPAPAPKPAPAPEAALAPASNTSLGAEPVLAPAPVASPATAPALSPAPAPSAKVPESARPVLAPGLSAVASASTAPRVAPSLAIPPAASAPPVRIHGVLARRDAMAPQSPAPPAASEVPAPPVPPPAAPKADEWHELDERIHEKAEAIEELLAPIHEELARAMEGGLDGMREQMESLEFDMRPLQEEMSRIGEEMSRKIMESMPDQLEIEEHSARMEVLAEEMARRSELMSERVRADGLDREAIDEAIRQMHQDLEPLREELMRERQEIQKLHLETQDMEVLMAPYREQMDALRDRMEPQRERMAAIQREMEPQMERLTAQHEERMAEVRARVDALRAELELLHRERYQDRVPDSN